MVICYDPEAGRFCDFSVIKREINADILEMFEGEGYTGDYSIEITINGYGKLLITCFCDGEVASISVYRKIFRDSLAFELEQLFTVLMNYGSKEIKNLYLKRVWDYIEEKSFLRYGKILSNLKTPFIVVYRHDRNAPDEVLNVVFGLISKIEEQIKK